MLAREQINWLLVPSGSGFAGVEHGHGRGDQAGDLGHVAGHDERGGGGAGHFGISIDGFFGDLELHCHFAARLADGAGDAFYGLGGGIGHGRDGGGFALGIVDGGKFGALGARDESFALARGDVDLFLAPTFGGGDQGTLFALGRDLRLHGVQNFLGWREVLDFVAQHLHTPVQRSLVDGGHDLRVDDVPFFKGLVEFELADDASQRGLCQLCHCDDVVGRTIAGAHRIGDLKVQDAINLQLRVVARDADLARHIQRYFFEAVLVGNAVDEGNQEIQARRE